MAVEFPYQKLPGRCRGLFVRGSVWLGADHFLSVKNLRFTEDYRRFYFRDVQAIVIRKTPRFYAPVWWLVALLACTVGRLFLPPLPRSILSAAIFAIAIWVVAAALFRSCRCHVQTAVSREEIPAWVRLGEARRAVEALTSKIAEAQGTLPEDWSEDPATVAGWEAIPVAPLPAVMTAEEPSVHANKGMWLALASFLLLLGDAVFTYFHSHHVLNRGWQAAGTVLIVIEAAIMVFSLVFLRGAKVLRAVRNLVIAGIVFAGSTYYVSYSTTILVQAMQQNPAMPKIDEQKLPFLFWIDTANEVGNAAVGVAGLVAWFTTRRKMAWPA
jgi:hypothetical protein